MRTWVLCAALSAALVVTPMWAQRGGGGHGGGLGGGHVSGFGGAHGYVGGARGYAGGAVVRGGLPSYSRVGRGPIFSTYSRGWNGFYGGRGYPYRYAGRYPYGYNWWRWRGYPWWGGYYAGWYPWWGWGGIGWYDFDDDYDYFDNDNYYPSYGNSYQPPTYPSEVYLGPSSGGYSQDNYAANEATQGEIQQLQSEVSQLQSQQENRSRGPGLQEFHTDTVLVYKDGRKQEVQNYAIVGKTLWIMNENKATKVPLSDLNLAATERDNEQRGIDFYLPSTQR
jgi:hypothetical protein